MTEFTFARLALWVRRSERIRAIATLYSADLIFSLVSRSVSALVEWKPYLAHAVARKFDLLIYLLRNTGLRPIIERSGALKIWTV
jgi:hypothetical protein